jgi:phage terminase large subunit-like protein
MVEFMRAGTKGRKQALILMITNSGHDRNTVCYQYHEYSRKVVQQQLPEDDTDSFFGYVCGLDEGDDWKDEAVWPKANPLLGTAIPLKYLREQVREAVGMPAKQNIVRRLNFCEWTEADAAWLSKDRWDSCLADIDVETLRDRRCWGGLDLSSKRDLTALSLAFEPGEDGIWDTISFLWTPEDTLAEREDKDRAPYTTWVRDGHLIAIPGRVIDYGWVAKQIGDLQEDFDLQSIAYDPHKIEYLEAELDEQGIDVALVPHSQGYFKPKDGVWMPKSVEIIEERIEKGEMRVQRNPVMTFCALSAVVVMDEHENKKFAKKKSTNRIDGMVSLAMAMGLANKANDETSAIPIAVWA